jgi:exosortase/archaeosortase family protein
MIAAVERIVALALWAVALRPVWTWWVRRLAEPWDADVAAWAALAVLVLDLWRRANWKLGRISAGRWVFSAAMLTLYAISVRTFPPTVAGLFGMLAGLPLLLPSRMEQRGLPLPLAGLALMGLPTVMILELFAGYPLRVFATQASAVLLAVAGFPVFVSGTEIAVGEASVWVDAPCAGVRMLGVGLWLGMAMAQVFRLSGRRTIVLGVVSLAAVVVSNVARIVVLTALELAGRHLSESAHELIGCLALVPGLALIAFLAFRLAERRAAGFVESVPARRPYPMLLFILVAALACLVPSRARPGGSPDAAFPGWPAEFGGQSLAEEPLTEVERAFAENFPGRVGRFRAGKGVVVLRFVERATHRVHPASACLTALGWRVEPLPMVRQDGGDWSAFRAAKGAASMVVHEQVRAVSGDASFPDVSIWFWRAVLGRTQGPWWSVVVYLPEAKTSD